MIKQTQLTVTRKTWQTALANAISDPAVLLGQLGLVGKLTAIDSKKIRQFPLKVPQHYVNNMHFGDANDPLLRQVFPLIDEAFDTNEYVTDPVGDHLAIITSGLLQKYSGRALLLTTGACAIHCRYCFRRHFPYGNHNPLGKQWQQTIATLKNNTTIDEIILSGGDPLMLSDTKLARLAADLDAIPHLKRLRIHTRLPVVLPERIDQYLLSWLKGTRLQTIMVIHANHANEIDDEVALGLSQLMAVGCQLLNQAVLLKGVNDNVDSLYNLSQRLSEMQVLPYYLHLLDTVSGASHFNVNDDKAIRLINQLHKSLPGYLVPRLVREQQGEPGKTIIA